MDSVTLTLSSTSSTLEAQYFPPIELSPNKNYVLGLVEFLTFNSFPNIHARNNKFNLVNGEEIIIPEGSYEIEDIEKFLQKKLAKKNILFNLRANNNTLRSEIKCSEAIDFRPKDSVSQVLGFGADILDANKYHKSNLPIKILKVNSMRIECNITTGAYINGDEAHTIHQFFPGVPAGYKIVEVPSEVIYLPVTVNRIDHLQLRIVDQDGDTIDFRGEDITIRLHLKSVT